MPRRAQSVLLIGHGAIARTVMAALRDDPQFTIAAILVRPERLREAAADDSIRRVSSIEAAGPVDCVLECAGHSAVREHVPTALRRGLDTILVSVGSLSEPGLPEVLEAAALEGNARSEEHTSELQSH